MPFKRVCWPVGEALGHWDDASYGKVEIVAVMALEAKCEVWRFLDFELQIERLEPPKA